MNILVKIILGIIALIAVLYVIPFTRPFVVWGFSLLNLWFNMDFLKSSVGGTIS